MNETFDEMTDIEKWVRRGYDTDESCCVCGATPGKLDPRFFFVVCRAHMDLTPVEIADTLKNRRRE